MANNDLLNASMSYASAISAIGLEQTMTEEFQGLKGLQIEVSCQVDQVVSHYHRVKDKVVYETQNGCGVVLIELETFNEERHAAVEALVDYYTKTAVAVHLYVDANSRKCVKKIHRFVNMMRVKLSATNEMAADDEPYIQDEAFLDGRETSFLASMMPAGAL